MAELHPSYLDSAEPNTGNQPTGGHKRLPEISNTVDWVQCFGIYMAIVSRSKPEHITDLIGFQSIIIGASQLRNNDGWILYDRRFHLKTSASCTRQWAIMVFPDRVIRWHQGQAPNICSTPLNFSQHPPRRTQPTPRRMSICLDWNDSPNGCTRTNCRYEHARCVHNPNEQDKHHKASQCLVTQRQRQQSDRPHPLLP